MIKKLGMLLLLALCLSVLFFSAALADTVADGTCGKNVTWTLDDKGLLTVTGTGAMDDFNWRGAPWYSKRENIQTVQIENGVTSIGSFAFYECTSLTGVTIPSSVTSIGDMALSTCTSLTSVTIPSSVTSIVVNPFHQSSNLESIQVESGSTAYASVEGVLFDKAQTTLITCPEGKSGACIIPSSVTSIVNYAFTRCTNLESIQVESGNTVYASVDGVLFDKAQTTLITCPGGKTGAYDIPSGVTSIRDEAFFYCTSLTSVTIPSSVTSIGNKVFFYCTSLTSVTIPSSVINIGNQAFTSCRSLTSVTIPDSVTSIGDSAFSFCYSLTSVTISTGVTSIGSRAFYDCYRLKDVYYTGSSEQWAAISIAADNGPLTSAVIHYNYGETEPEVIASGSCGESVNWTLDSDGLLTISGTGAMDDYDWGGPWYSSRGTIQTVQIENGVTRIGDFAFFDSDSLTSVTVPSSVTSIGDSAFAGCTNLTGVTIPSSVTSIGDEAFTGCRGLTSVTIPSSVTSIGSQAFWNCESLTSIQVESGSTTYVSVDGVLFNKALTTLITCPETKTGEYVIPSTVISIGNYAFYRCASLTSVTIASGVTSIGDEAFYGCTSLTSVTIPSSVTSIGDGAFSGCSSLTIVTIPSSVTSIGNSAFSSCISLASIQVESGSATYVSVDGVLFDKTQTTLIACPGGKTGSYAIPSNVTSIGADAFYFCYWLTSVTIPSSVTSIGDRAFGYCNSLTKAAIPSSVTSIGEAVFLGCSNLTNVTVPSSVTSIGVAAFLGCSGLTDVFYTGSSEQWAGISIGLHNEDLAGATIHYNYVETESEAIASGTCGKNVNWTLDDNGLLAISGTGAMYDYDKTGPWYSTRETIQTVQIENGVTSIGSYVFLGFSNLTDVTIPSSVTSIGGAAFDGCTSLTSVTIPASVTSIGIYAFSSCASLASIQVESGSATYVSVDGVLFDKDRTTLIAYPGGKTGAYAIPSSVTSIGECAFYLCDSLTSVIIPSSVTSIGGQAFAYCTSLTSVTIPSSITSIWHDAFQGCTGLASIQVESGSATYVSVDGVLFDKDRTTLIACPGGKTGAYAIPSSVTSIGRWAFSDCFGLTSVTIPSSVTSIGYGAFVFCRFLTSVTIPSSVTSIGDNAFRECTRLTDVYYTGSSGQWAEISIGQNNDSLTNAEIHCDYVETEPKVIAGGSCGKNVSWKLNDRGLLTISGTGPMEGWVPSIQETDSIVQVLIEDGVTSISSWAFANWGNLTTITIPDSVKSIGSVAFYRCYRLENVKIPDGVTIIEDWTFTDCSSLTGMTIPNGVTSIGAYAFSCCTSLERVAIPDGVTSIGERAFNGCTGLTSVTIPDSVSSIGAIAFYGCDNLTDVFYSGNSEQWAAISIEEYNEPLTNAEIHYNYGTIITVLILPASLTVIESEAFTGLSSVDAVSIPATVTSIADDAFDAGIVIIAPAGSYAETWAKDHSFTVNHP